MSEEIQTFYEAFGTSNKDEPFVQKCREQPTEPFPEDELYRNVSRIEISILGDDPDTALVHVYGVHAEDCLRAWLSAKYIMENKAGQMWPWRENSHPDHVPSDEELEAKRKGLLP